RGSRIDIGPRAFSFQTKVLLGGGLLLRHFGAVLRVLAERAVFGLSSPLIDCLDREPPIAAHAERRKLVFLQHPVNGRGMDPQVAGNLLNGEYPSLHDFHTIHLTTSHPPCWETFFPTLQTCGIGSRE